MGLIVDLTTEEVAQLKLYTHAEDGAAAVSQAAREYIRLNRLRELKAVAGKLDFDDVSLQLETMELSEVDFPN